MSGQVEPDTKAKLDKQAQRLTQHYMLALSLIATLIIGSCLLMQTAFDIQEIKLRGNALATDQSRLFTEIGSLTRALMQSAAGDRVPEQALQALRASIDEKIARVRANTSEILAIDGDRLFGLFKGGAVARLYEQGPIPLEKKLSKFLSRADEISSMETSRLRSRLQQWSPIDVIVSSGSMIQNDFDQAMLNSFKSTEQHIIWIKLVDLLINVAAVSLIVVEASCIFAPLVKKLRSEHASTLLYQERLKSQSRIDGLSGLGNRIAFQELLLLAIDECRTSQNPFGLILFDLDRFKPINDSLGHAAGDALLMAVADRARTWAGHGAFVARLGGDEFGILARDAGSEDPLRALVGRIKQAIEQPVTYEGHEILPMVSFGAAIIDPVNPEGADELLRAADTALYKAKQQRTGFAFLDDVMKAEITADTQTAADFRQALERDELEVFYQPQVRLLDNTIVGFEALIRWNHPERGLLSPGVFLHAAERHGLMRELTIFVINRVSDDLQRWLDRSCDPGVIAINMPEAMLASGLGRKAIDLALARNAIDRNRICVEVTEDVLLDRNAELIAETLRAMRSDGIRVSFDDFGTGYASLSHLRQFPLDEIKIDQSFIKDIGNEHSSAEIVCSLIQLAGKLKKTVVAEGIETSDQLRFLVANGCHVGQGYIFSRPVTFGAALELIQAKRFPNRVGDVDTGRTLCLETYRDVA